MTLRPLVLLVLPTLGLGCASTAPDLPPAFSFEVDGRTYGIAPTNDGADRVNDLVWLEDGRLRLRARDRDQDGRLDTVLVGTLSLAEADAIYARGIANARRSGAYDERPPARTMSIRDRGRTLVVWSVASGGASWENRFAVYDGTRTSPTASDVDADGTLDDHTELQAEYDRALAVGAADGRTETINGRIRVLPSAGPPRR